ncbi:DUF3098 domain-containing protein [Aliifodinibius salicampi]|uniref:DUF3098 domain-containing protein n=1 Tax=Fodinibius salicampi TaxID=1920655 RepID=A0ABT3PUT6_9BACT|nr:hypothetical protein [Fodinibius salicampi]MCW9711603.1 DUF3098 domain-containing protein [Fodinibius salicampi]
MVAQKSKGRNSKKPMIFSPWNYKVLALGLLLVIAGFTAMYLENEVEGIISLYISPIVIMGGYITVVVAILKHDGGSSAMSSDQS